MAKQVSSTNEIAEALIRLGVVGREQFEAELERGRLKGEEFARTTGTKVVASQDAAAKAAERMGLSQSRLGTTLLDVKRSAGEQIEVITSLIGKITAVVGVATLFYNIGEKISDVLFKNTARAERFAKAVEESNASIARGSKIAQAFKPRGYAGNFFDQNEADLNAAQRIIQDTENLDPNFAAEVRRKLRQYGPEFFRKNPDDVESPYALAVTQADRLRPLVNRQQGDERAAQQNEQMMALLKEIADNTKQRSN